MAALVRSLTATKSISCLPIAARMMLRPIRPKPLMPTLTAIDLSYAGRTLRSASAPLVKHSILMTRVERGQSARYTAFTLRASFPAT